MRYLILSDIHSNWHALQAVLQHANGLYDQIVCCGDVVGYGGHPNEVTEWCQNHATHIVRGNHDKACTGSEEIEWFNTAAHSAALWTMHTLTPPHTSYLQGLARGPQTVDGAQTEPFQILHGSPADEDEYLLTPADAGQAAHYLDAFVGFFGHTHIQGGFLCHRNGVRRIRRIGAPESEYVLELEPDLVYLLNPGSVGQPRDHDPRAAYLIYLPQDKLVSFQRVPYDVAAAQAGIREAGLPDILAERLEHGQ